MTVVETLGPSAAVKLVCSDIDTKVLATAQRGVYATDARGLIARAAAAALPARQRCATAASSASGPSWRG